MDRRSALRTVVGGVTIGVAGCLGRNGDDGDDGGGAGNDGNGSPPPTLGSSPTIESPAFDDGESVPTRFTCDGNDASPELHVADVPDDASSLALLVDDPDAPGGTFTHWLLWDVPPSTETVPEDVPRGETVERLDGAKQGTNDGDVVGYSGPCPPPDDGPHTYRFRLIALGERPGLEAGASREDFGAAIGDVARSEAVLRGTYDR